MVRLSHSRKVMYLEGVQAMITHPLLHSVNLVRGNASDKVVAFSEGCVVVSYDFTLTSIPNDIITFRKHSFSH